jgi:hypothetical protein
MLTLSATIWKTVKSVKRSAIDKDWLCKVPVDEVVLLPERLLARRMTLRFLKK